jgi:hypothetical protein
VRIIGLLLALFYYSLASALTATSKNSVTTSERMAKGKIYFLSDSYTTPIDDIPDLNTSKLFSLDLNLTGTGDSWLALSDFQGGHYSEVNNSYFAVREMYFEYQIQKNLVYDENPQMDFHHKGVPGHPDMNSYLGLGRKFEKWSVLEQTWSLSLWEPHFTLDALRPIPQGLSGLFFGVQGTYFRIMAFASTLYVPNMGPEVKPDRDGIIEVNSRWAKRPNREFPFNGKSTQILYSLDLPSVGKIVNQKSVAVLSSVGNLQSGFWGSVSLARKPVNDLVLSYQGFLRLRDDGSYGDVKIAPHVINHEIANLDMGYTGENQGVVLSHLSERPNNLTPEPGWSYQQFEAIEASSVRWEWTPYHYLNNPAKVSVSRLYLQGGRIREFDSDMKETHVLDGMRVKFTNAWAFDFQTPLWGNSKPLLAGKLHFVRDIIEQGSLMNTEIYIRTTPELSLILGIDIIGVRDNSESNNSKGFLNQHRANDRFYGGVAYVF